MQTITIKDVTDHLERLAPVSYQEPYDNSGLITGSPEWNVTGIMVALDCVETVIDEAINSKSNLIVAHHPILFKSLKKLTGRNYVERTLIKAIKNDIAIYAIHTNLDNVRQGVNKKIAERMGLEETEILAPKNFTQSKLVTFIPAENVEQVLNALHKAGAGNIGNYEHCSFRTMGTGTFKPTSDANPHIGKSNQLENVQEVRVELLLPSHLKHEVIKALKDSHPYEEVAYYLTSLENENVQVGSGLIGHMAKSMEPIAFLEFVKSRMKTDCIRYTCIPKRQISRVAICGGAGSFLLGIARSRKADAYISADFKYHEFFDADGDILVADIGHYESEQFTKELLVEVLSEKFPNFAINFSKTVTNPISYL